MVTLNYIATFALLTIYEIGVMEGWRTLYTIGIIVFVLFIAISFYYAFGKSGLWRFTHLPVAKLDEREMQIIYISLRLAYSFFTIASILLIYIFLIADLKVNAVLAAVLIYLAHILPASIVAWTERAK